MVSETKIDEFVKRVREAAAENLVSVILFGSAVAGHYHPEYSDLNIFCVLRDSGFPAWQTLAPVVQWWNRQKQTPPLLMTRAELERSTDIFTIELLDMKQHHRVLFGEDVLPGLTISMHRHHVQVEYELREKLILLRQQFLLVADNKARIWDLLLHSVPSFATLFRHALIALRQDAPGGKREAVQALAKLVGFDPTAMDQVLEARECKTGPGKTDVPELFARYLAAIEYVTAAVDQALDAEAASRS